MFLSKQSVSLDKQLKIKEVMKIKDSKFGIVSAGIKLSSSKIPTPKKTQRNSEMFNSFLTLGTWSVLNINTRKKMIIRKGQLVIQLGPGLFSTMDGRRFIQLDSPTNVTLLRPVFQDSSIIWACSV